MKVTLIATVKDAAEHVGEFLDSVRGQTRPPEEIVVVDGGSTDGTLELLRDSKDITFIESPGANIAHGRNLAIGHATHEVIAVSDADCVLEPEWLERLTSALEDGAGVAMGFYRPMPRSFFEACAAAVSLPEPEEVDPNRFLPSSRSIAFTRDAFDRAGGYPEWLDIGEDMYLNHRFRDAGLRMDFVPGAVARWRPRPTLGATWRQYFAYAEGDGLAGMHPQRHTLRFAAYGTLAYAVLARRRGLLAAAALAGAWYARRPIRRAMRLVEPAQRAKAIRTVPALMLAADAAKMAGYVAGRIRRLRG